MPIHDSGRVEYAIHSGYINIITDDGKQVPAYWAHPRIGHQFSGICLLHDWWGMNTVSRLLANFFAQMGYYVIEPDLFGGKTANTPQQAMRLLQKSQATRFATADAALSVLESHHRINASVAAIGMGMGGTLAFEAAIKRDDIEAAVAYGGFPQQFIGEFNQCQIPLLAIYGSQEPYTKAAVIKRMQIELAQTARQEDHEIVVIEGGGHDLFSDKLDDSLRLISKIAINHTLKFLEKHLERPPDMPKPQQY